VAGSVLLAVLLISSGCVQGRMNPEGPKPAKLMISRGVNGVTMQWKGEVGTTYTLYYRDGSGPQASWKPVPGYEEKLGTGDLITFQDRSPMAKQRQFRVHTLSIQR
jgi:hypothetical protein